MDMDEIQLYHLKENHLQFGAHLKNLFAAGEIHVDVRTRLDPYTGNDQILHDFARTAYQYGPDGEIVKWEDAPAAARIHGHAFRMVAERPTDLKQALVLLTAKDMIDLKNERAASARGNMVFLYHGKKFIKDDFKEAIIGLDAFNGPALDSPPPRGLSRAVISLRRGARRIKMALTLGGAAG